MNAIHFPRDSHLAPGTWTQRHERTLVRCPECHCINREDSVQGDLVWVLCGNDFCTFKSWVRLEPAAE